MKVRAERSQGYAFALTARGHVLASDQSPDFGGEDQGPMPSELLLWAVAACFGQTMVFVAHKLRTPLADLVVEVEGAKDAKACRYVGLHIAVSADVPAQRLEKLVQMARRYCYVTRSLAPDLDLVVEVRDPGGTQPRRSAPTGAAPGGTDPRWAASGGANPGGADLSGAEPAAPAR